MSEAWCEWSQLPVSGCAHCKRDRKVITAEPVDFAALADMAGDDGEGVGPLIGARYAGRCPCGARIEEGDPIRYSVAEGKYVCGDCGGP